MTHVPDTWPMTAGSSAVSPAMQPRMPESNGQDVRIPLSLAVMALHLASVGAAMKSRSNSTLHANWFSAPAVGSAATRASMAATFIKVLVLEKMCVLMVEEDDDGIAFFFRPLRRRSVCKMCEEIRRSGGKREKEAKNIYSAQYCS